MKQALKATDKHKKTYKMFLKLSDEKKEIASIFIRTLKKSEKYSELRKEIELRKKQIENGEYSTQEEFWKDIL